MHQAKDASVMTEVLLIALFTATVLVIAGAMRATWREHGQQALTIRAQLDACQPQRDVRWTIREVRSVSRVNVVAFPLRQRVVLAPLRQPAAA